MRATLAAARARAAERNTENLAAAREHLGGAAAFPGRAAQNLLVGAFLTDFYALVASRAEWADRQVQAWPDPWHGGAVADTEQDDIERARELIAAARSVTVLTGAGVSTDSGIPDFRGPQGVWTKNPAAERIWTYEHYCDDPEVRRTAWQERVEHPMWTARPGPAHDALVRLERSGKLTALLTQNIDELHQAAGSSPDRVVELHGTNHHTVCLDCGAVAPMAEALDRVRAGEDDPACAPCGGVLKATTIMFGEMLDMDVLERSRRAALDCDVFLAVGTSLGVHPAAGLVDLAAMAGAEVVIVNGEPTPYDRVAAVVLRGGISEVLPAIL